MAHPAGTVTAADARAASVARQNRRSQPSQPRRGRPSGLSVYVSGRRDEARWLRESLLETFEAFFNASFETTGAAKHLSGLAMPGSIPSEQEIRNRINNAYVEKLTLLTRLRLLASDDVVEAASGLQFSDARFIEVMTGAGQGLTIEQYEAARREAHKWRENFLAAARRMLKVDSLVAQVRDVSDPRQAS